MNCEQLKENIYKYLDNELEQNFNREVQEHLSRCPLCKLQLEREEKFNKLIKNHVHKEEAPYALREQIMKDLEKPVLFPGLHGLKWTRPFLYSASAAMVVLVLVISVFTYINKPFPVFAESIENHMDYLKGSYPVEVKTESMDEALQWFKGKTNFAVERPHVSLDKVKLIGARITHLKDRKTAYFVFEKDGHTISAFFVDFEGTRLPKVAKADTMDKEDVTIYVKNQNGYRSVLCFHKKLGTGCAIVSDLPFDQLMQLLG